MYPALAPLLKQRLYPSITKRHHIDPIYSADGGDLVGANGQGAECITIL